MRVFSKAINIVPRKIDVKTLVLVVLTIIILIQILFMWFFVKKQTPVIGLTPLSLTGQLSPRYLFSLGAQANNPGAALDAPLDVAVDGQGRAFVADTGHNAVKVYNAYGQYQFQFGKAGNGPGELSEPTGIAVDGKHIYVAEAGNQRISVFDLKGNFVDFLVENKELPQLKGFVPCGITLTPRGDLLVTDIFQHRVLGFDKAGKVILAFGKPGQEKGAFAYPNDVAVDESGHIYVSDSNNARVQVFDSKGRFLHFLEGQDPRQKFSLPRGITVHKDKIFVVDTFSHQVRIISANSEQITTFGEFGDGNGQLNFPNGVTVYGDKIFVTDRANDRVAVFAY